MKICTKCTKEKNPEDFGNDKKGKNGKSTHCKTCIAKYQKEYQQGLRRKFGSSLGRSRESILRQQNQQKEYRNRTLEKARAYTRKWAAKNKEKIAAHREVWKALKNKTLSKGQCEICGTKVVDAHHRDYSKPLEIQWLCRSHHRKEHSILKT